MADKIGVMKAMRNFFGMKPGQSLNEFAAEIKALTTTEKMELADGAAKALGCELEDISMKAET